MLEISIPTILLEILNFLLLSALLYRFLFKPVMQRVEKRAAEKSRLKSEMEADREAAARLREDLQARLASIEDEVAQIVEKGSRQIEAERHAALEAVRAEAERTLHHAQLEARRAQKRELEELRAELLDTVLAISGQVIGQAAPPEVHDALVKEIHDRVWELGRGGDLRQVETLRRSLGGREPVVHAVSARALSLEQQAQLARTFSALADRSVKLEHETDSALTLGLRVRIGDLVVDNSLAGHLDDLRSEVAQRFRERAK